MSDFPMTLQRLNRVIDRGDVWTPVQKLMLDALAADPSRLVLVETYLRTAIQARGNSGDPEFVAAEANLLPVVEEVVSLIRADHLDHAVDNEPTNAADVMTGAITMAVPMIAEAVIEFVHDPIRWERYLPTDRLSDTVYAICVKAIATLEASEADRIRLRAHDLHGADADYQETVPEVEGRTPFVHDDGAGLTRRRAEAILGAFGVMVRTVSEHNGVDHKRYRMGLSWKQAEPRKIVISYQGHPSETKVQDDVYLADWEPKEMELVYENGIDLCLLPTRSAINAMDAQFRWLSLVEGREAEIRAQGFDPETAPAWSFAAPLLFARVLQDEKRRDPVALRTDKPSRDWTQGDKLGHKAVWYNASQSGGVFGLAGIEFAGGLVYRHENDRHILTYKSDKRLPETFIQASKGTALSRLIKHHALDDPRIVIVDARYNEASGELVAVVTMPIVRLAEPPAGVEKDPVKAWAPTPVAA